MSDEKEKHSSTAKTPKATGRGAAAAGMNPGDKPTNFKASAKRMITLLRHDRLRSTLVLIMVVIGSIVPVFGPKLLGDATNIVFTGLIGAHLPAGTSKASLVQMLRAKGENKRADMLNAMDLIPGQGIDWQQLAWLLGILAALYLLTAIVQVFAANMMRTVVQRMGWRLRAQVQAKIDRLELRYLDNNSRGDLLSRVTNDIDNVTQTMLQTLTQVVTSVIMVIGIAAIMLWISWELALIAIMVVPLVALVAKFIMAKSGPWFSRQWKATGQVSGIVEESFSGHEVVQAYGLEEAFEKDFKAANEELFKASFKAQFFSGIMQPIMSALSNLSYVIVAVLGALWVASGSLSIGAVQAFIQYSRQFTQPLAQIAGMANLLQSGVASAERVFEFLDADEQGPTVRKHPLGRAQAAAKAEDCTLAATPIQSGKQTAIKVGSTIVFDHVCFGYSPDKPVLKDVCLTVYPGETVAIVGPTGGGKTTLINLLMRFYEVDSGAILIDGVDIRDIPRDELRKRIGIVLQDTWLFEGTIADNIAFGKVDATRSEVEIAAKETNVDHLIRTLPQGYDTVLDDEGGGVSSGEKQLLTIARAFLSDPEILILDEATSSVDTRTEVVVGQAMTRLRAGRTGFVIAHRLSTIRNADVIVVLENGTIAQRGTHDELLAAGGSYAQLHANSVGGAAMDQ